MDATMKNFLAILNAALVNERAELEGEILPEEWNTLFRMAGIHNVMPLFYEAAYPALQQAGLPLLPVIRRKVMQQVLMQTMRTEAFLSLNQTLQAAGVQPLVVKGII